MDELRHQKGTRLPFSVLKTLRSPRPRTVGEDRLMLCAFRRLRGTLVMSLLTGAVWAPAGAIVSVVWMYVMVSRAGVAAPPLSAMWGYALRGAFVFGAWGALTGTLSAFGLIALARWRSRFRDVSLRRAIAYGGIGQALLLTGARLIAVRLPWHTAAVALREMPIPLVAITGATVVASGLLLLRRSEHLEPVSS